MTFDPIASVRSFISIDTINNLIVTTIELNIPGFPMSWETAVNCEPVRNYDSREDALKGHKEVVNELIDLP